MQRLVWAVTKLGATLRVEVMLQAIGRFVGVVCFRVCVVLEWGVFVDVLGRGGMVCVDVLVRWESGRDDPPQVPRGSRQAPASTAAASRGRRPHIATLPTASTAARVPGTPPSPFWASR